MNGNIWVEQSQNNRISNFMYKVYAFMAAALIITGITAYWVSQTPAIYNALFSNSWLLIGIFVVQIGLVLAISFLMNRLSFPMLLCLFILYAISLGVTLSSVFIMYQLGSIYLTFFITALMFAVMAVYGYFTKTDLTAMGNLARMALFGIIIALVVNLYFRSPMMDLIVSGIGVIVFTGLIAYDSQKIKQMGSQMLSGNYNPNNIALVGALMLYLDVINLFLFLLRFLGKRKE